MIPPRWPLGPDATIGILGGGQLGRMLALAAARLGFKCHVLCPDPGSPAFDVVRRVTEADYADMAALDRFAADVDVVTYEFENVPAETASFCRRASRCCPTRRCWRSRRTVSPRRVREKSRHRHREFRRVDSPGVSQRAEMVGQPAVLKTRALVRRQGQLMIRNGGDPAACSTIWRSSADPRSVRSVRAEISMVAARGADGRSCFDVIENEHADHILKPRAFPRMSRRPWPRGRRSRKNRAKLRLRRRAGGGAFVVRDGAGHAVLVNEIAPRVHNSGHWTSTAPRCRSSNSTSAPWRAAAGHRSAAGASR